MTTTAKILIIEDDKTARRTLGEIAQDIGHEVILAADGKEGLALLEEHPDVRLVLSDVVMPGMDGIEVLEHVLREHPGIPVVMMSAFATVPKTVRAIQMGAVDFLEKPLQLHELRGTIQRALELGSTPRPAEDVAEVGLGQMVGTSPPMRSLFENIVQVARSRASVLIQGASGTGKELIAREIHNLSGRSGPLVAVHCASLPESLIESELFGHAKGAFTGAAADRKGRFEEAHGGTLFLDEISEVPLDMQVKLLRVLQEREVTRVGEARSRKVDVRVISASNRDLKEDVQSGRFREDLYYRVKVVQLDVPPLAQRKEDVGLLVNHLLARKNADNDRTIERVTPEAMQMLRAYDWPGNVRELENVIENGVVMARGDEITPELLPLEVRLAGRKGGVAEGVGVAPDAEVSTEDGESPAFSVRIGTPLEEVEREMILRTLDAVDGNKTMAAKILGIGARTLYRKLEQYGEHTRNPEGDAAPEETAQ